MKIQRQFLTLASVASLFLFQNCSKESFAENSSTGTAVNAVVCSGISNSSTCNTTASKVSGSIYYLTAAQQAASGTLGLDTYFNYGTKMNATIVFDQLFIPTTYFSQGFPTSMGATPSYLTDESGNKLIEYFAMKLQTNLALTSGDRAGIYQLALISDDGARIIRLDTNETTVDGDGSHSSELSCGSAMNLAVGQTVPLEIDYYQGPRYEIALTLMWRKVNSSSASDLADSLCGVSGDSAYFGPNFNDYSTNYGYGQLLARGWSVVPSANLSAVGNQ